MDKVYIFLIWRKLGVLFFSVNRDDEVGFGFYGIFNENIWVKYFLIYIEIYFRCIEKRFSRIFFDMICFRVLLWLGINKI